MSRRRLDTRTALLDAAEGLVLEQGFAATSIDRLIERVGVTKGAFFHHFASKSDLAHALVERYAERERSMVDGLVARAEAMTGDPLQQVLIMVGLMRELLVAPNPGCLFASYCYEQQLFDDATLDIARGSVRRWRDVVGSKLREAVRLRPPAVSVEPEQLADMLNALVEGAFIQSRIMSEPQAVAEQLGHFRNYLELLFAPKA